MEWDGLEEWESVPVELANMLVSGSTYKNKERFAEPTLETINVTVTDELPRQIRRKSDDTLYRRYETDRGVTIAVTNFELARALFFHNQYLIRAAFSSKGLKELAFFNEDLNEPKIIFPDSTRYPVSNIRTRASKSHLAWLYTDQLAAKSFFSIFEVVNRIDSNGVYEFSFAPPPVLDWNFEVAGIYSEDRKNFWVSEILTVNNNSFFAPEGLMIKHPKMKHLVQVPRKERKYSKLPPSDPDPSLDLGELPMLGRRIHRKDDKKFSFNLNSAGHIGIEKDDEHEWPEKPQNIPSAQQATEQTSVGAATQHGSNQEFDYGLNRNKDEFEASDLIDAEPTEKFRLFERTVEIIECREDFVVHGVRCGSFPPPKTGSRMVLNTVDGSFLRYHMANISYRDIGVIVIEVDVGSLLRPVNVSTLVVAFLSDSNPDEILKRIMQDYSDRAKGWNHEWIKKNTAVCKFCRHPKTTKKENNIERSITADEYVEAWADILDGKLVEMWGVDNVKN